MKTIRTKLLIFLTVIFMAIPAMSQTNIGNYGRMNVKSLLNIMADSLKWDGCIVYKDSMYYTEVAGDSVRFKLFCDPIWSPWIGTTDVYFQAKDWVNGAYLRTVTEYGQKDSIFLVEQGNVDLIRMADDNLIIKTWVDRWARQS